MTFKKKMLKEMAKKAVIAIPASAIAFYAGSVGGAVGWIVAGVALSLWDATGEAGK